MVDQAPYPNGPNPQRSRPWKGIVILLCEKHLPIGSSEKTRFRQQTGQCCFEIYSTTQYTYKAKDKDKDKETKRQRQSHIQRQENSNVGQKRPDRGNSRRRVLFWDVWPDGLNSPVYVFVFVFLFVFVFVFDFVFLSFWKGPIEATADAECCFETSGPTVGPGTEQRPLTPPSGPTSTLLYKW